MDKKTSKVPVKQEEGTSSMARSGWDRFLNLRSEIDHLFDEFTDSWPFMSRSGRAKAQQMMSPFAFAERLPAVDLCDKKDKIEIKAELPGMDEKDINVEMTDHLLTISGEKKEEREEGEKEGNYYMSERRYGSFRRSIALPEGVDTNKVDATFKKGVLNITMQKTPEAREKVKKIKVKASA